MSSTWLGVSDSDRGNVSVFANALIFLSSVLDSTYENNTMNCTRGVEIQENLLSKLHEALILKKIPSTSKSVVNCC